jgi:hypothetical protein
MQTDVYLQKTDNCKFCVVFALMSVELLTAYSDASYAMPAKFVIQRASSKHQEHQSVGN